MNGFSKTRLGRVRDVLAGHVRRGTVPGVVALLSRGGQTHLEQAGDVSPDTIFRISSMTKPVVSLAAMMLYEEDERLQNISALTEDARMVSASDKAAGLYIKRQVDEAFMHAPDFDWKPIGR